jgi:hypothetical protein
MRKCECDCVLGFRTGGALIVAYKCEGWKEKDRIEREVGGEAQGEDEGQRTSGDGVCYCVEDECVRDYARRASDTRCNCERIEEVSSMDSA